MNGTPNDSRREGIPRLSFAAIVELIDVAREFPRSTNTDGLPTVARRWGASSEAVALADQLAEYVASLDAVAAPLRVAA